MLREEELGHCDLRTDLAGGGELPALAGGATIEGFAVEAPWRNPGLGAWLLTHAIAWMRLAGRDRGASRSLTTRGLAPAGQPAAAVWSGSPVRRRPGWPRTPSGG